MKTSLQSFKLGLQLSATQDDGAIDREEKKDMKRLEKAADKFMEELEKVMKE
jgi:cob(I)alamin adenosyltransferase